MDLESSTRLSQVDRGSRLAGCRPSYGRGQGAAHAHPTSWRI